MTEQQIQKALAAPLKDFIAGEFAPSELKGKLEQTLADTEGAGKTYYAFLYDTRVFKAVSRFDREGGKDVDLLRREIIDTLLEFREYAYHVDDTESELLEEDQDKPFWEIEYYDIAGLYYHRRQIRELCRDNPDYSRSQAELVEDEMVDCDIPRYLFDQQDAELVYESENPSDPNAIRVDVSGKTVGYIKRRETEEIRDLLSHHQIGNISCMITGGPSRILYSGYSPARDKAIYESVEREQAAYKGSLRLCIGPEMKMQDLVGKHVQIVSNEHEKWEGRVYLYLDAKDDIKGEEALLLDIEGVPSIYRIPVEDMISILVLES
ncbi:MAG: HIRAN domain-containing protein [Pseudoramibacter sp.]